jgi:hypothetical protein
MVLEEGLPAHICYNRKRGGVKKGENRGLHFSLVPYSRIAPSTASLENEKNEKITRGGPRTGNSLCLERRLKPRRGLGDLSLPASPTQERGSIFPPLTIPRRPAGRRFPRNEQEPK